MKITEFNDLKIGDVVSPLLGKNKGRLAIVTFIWDVTDDTKYREILVSAKFKYKQLNETVNGDDIMISYRSLKKEN